MTTRVEILEAVWRVDPAGISAVREDNPDEYDELVDGIYAQLLQAHSDQEIVKWANQYFTKVWGISLRADLLLQLEKLVVAWNPPLKLGLSNGREERADDSLGLGRQCGLLS